MGESFGIRLRSYRLKSGRTVAEICGILEITNSAYYKYESEESSLDTNKVIRLCKFLGCDPNYLFGFEDDSHKWSQLAIKAGHMVTNFPDEKQKLAVYLLHAIKLKITAREFADYDLESRGFGI